MPNEHVNQLNHEQKARLVALARNTQNLKHYYLDTESLLTEANAEYAKAMNKIIFDKFRKECPNEILAKDMILPYNGEEEEEVPYFGQIQLNTDKNSKDFTENFKDFCFNSVFVRPEAVSAIQQIKIECNTSIEVPLFLTSFKEPMKLEEFRSQQDSTISAALYHLKGGWINQVFSIIQKEFGSVESGWFKLAEASKDSYECGKLKKFLTLTKHLMQNNLQSMIRVNFEQFFDLLIGLVPTKVKVGSTQNVQNEFTNLELTASGKPIPKTPLFYIEITQSLTDAEF